MNRKNYQAPSIRVVELHSPQHLLAGSNSGSGGPAHAPRYVYDNFDEGE